jgi:rhodanese-related sulfurtransferase
MGNELFAGSQNGRFTSHKVVAEGGVLGYNARFIRQQNSRFLRRTTMKEVSPKEAYELMQNDPEYIYLDVRSTMEFDDGHPVGAVNVPIMNFTPGFGMTPNHDFVQTIDAQFPKDAKLVIGCKSGGRSAQACVIMEKMGYTNVANVRGGFVGAVDQMGRLVEPGWSMVDLPVER